MTTYIRQSSVCPGSSDPPEKIFNTFASENEVYVIYLLLQYFKVEYYLFTEQNNFRSQLDKIVRFNILGRVTTSWTYSTLIK